jgi:hypothetical protein
MRNIPTCFLLIPHGVQLKQGAYELQKAARCIPHRPDRDVEISSRPSAKGTARELAIQFSRR